MASITLGRLAYETAVRALQDQERELGELRSRTGTLLAAGSLTSSFLGAAALHDGSLGILGALALLAFIASTVCSVYLLFPKDQLVFSLNGRILYESLAGVRGGEAELYRRLAFWLERYWLENRAKIEPLNAWFIAASVSLVIEIVLWVIALRSTIF